MQYSKLGYWGPQAGAVLLAGLAIVIVFWVLPPGLSLAKGAILAAVSVVAVAIALSAYRNADEVILQTHKTAWFWGSMATVALVPALVIAFQMHAVEILTLLHFQNRQPADYFAVGVTAILLLECIGFLVFWAYYNLRRRF